MINAYLHYLRKAGRYSCTYFAQAPGPLVGTRGLLDLELVDSVPPIFFLSSHDFQS